MYYTVYKITNLLNSKFYIGVHKTKDLNDSYMGSGKMISRAIAKHGLENFKKEYLAIFDNADDMFKLESELVNEEFVKSADSYNLTIGGSGGWYERSTVESLSKGGRNAISKLLEANTKNPSWRQQAVKTFQERFHNDPIFKESHIEHLSKAFLGKSHSDSTRKRMSESHQGKHSGAANSQFGSMWITDRVSNKKISKNDPIPQGWMKGRI